MPTQASYKQKAQNRYRISLVDTLIASENALTVHTRELSFACKVRLLSCAFSSRKFEVGGGAGRYVTTEVYKRDPSIMDIMNAEKM